MPEYKQCHYFTKFLSRKKVLPSYSSQIKEAIIIRYISCSIFIVHKVLHMLSHFEMQPRFYIHEVTVFPPPPKKERKGVAFHLTNKTR